MSRTDRAYRLTLPVLLGACLASQVAHATTLAEALGGGTAYGDFRLRYETAEQDNPLKDAHALTLRSRLGYRTGELSGFSAVIEFEDSRVIGGVDDYNDALGSRPDYSTIADPETTELDQGFVQYKAGGFQTRLGRQLLNYDNVRFVGDVGWRQDRQTFDALDFIYELGDALKVEYAYVDQRNRIFAEELDIDSSDHLLNAGWKTGLGKLTGYAYLLEEDDNTRLSIDTYGARFSGATDNGGLKLLYTAEYATQDTASRGGPDRDADYYFLEGGIGVGGLTFKLGYEVLGSDDGEYGFAAPLGTLHKFNGWADLFLTTPNEGLVDTYASVGGGLLGGSWSVIYHDFAADDGNQISDDFGDEWNLIYSRNFRKHYYAGIKYASYGAKDPANNGSKVLVDTDKLWVWAGARF